MSYTLYDSVARNAAHDELLISNNNYIHMHTYIQHLQFVAANVSSHRAERGVQPVTSLLTHRLTLSRDVTVLQQRTLVSF